MTKMTHNKYKHLFFYAFQAKTDGKWYVGKYEHGVTSLWGYTLYGYRGMTEEQAKHEAEIANKNHAERYPDNKR